MERTTRMLLLAATIFAPVLPAGAGIVYYTAEGRGPASHLYAYDTQTSDIADLGQLYQQTFVTDLALREGLLYGIGWSNASASGASKLLGLTPGSQTQDADWALQTVHANAMERSANGAVFDAAGSLYISSYFGNFQKLTYDAGHERWQVAKTGALGGLSGGDLTFSADGSTLYAALAGGVLATVDFDTGSRNFGKATVIGQTGFSDIFGLAMVDGLLYGTTCQGNYGRSFLVRIDPQTAQSTVVSDLGTGVWGATGGGAIMPAVVPEPMSAALILLGGLGLHVRAIRRQRRSPIAIPRAWRPCRR